MYGSWLGSLADEMGVDRNDDHAFRAFKRKMRPGIARIIEAASTKTLVACANREEKLLMGWVCGEPGALHFVYVAKPWREGRLGTALVRALELSGEVKASHFTSWGFPRVERMVPGIRFDPTLLIAER